MSKSNVGRISRWFLAMLALVVSSSALAQTHLIAFTGKDSNAPDEFAFVALNDIPNSTQIFFTNCDWDNTTGAFINPCNEAVLVFTATALIPRGTVVQVQEQEPAMQNVFVVTGDGTAVLVAGAGNSTWAAVSADPHYGFAASSGVTPLTTVTEIYAYMDTDPDTAVGGIKDPTIGTNSSPDAVVLDFAVIQPVGTDFTGDRSTATLADLTNPANFSNTSDIALDLTMFTGGSLPVELLNFTVE